MPANAAGVGGAAEVGKCLLSSCQMVLSSLSNLGRVAGPSQKFETEEQSQTGQTKTRQPQFSGPSGAEIFGPWPHTVSQLATGLALL